MARVTSAKEDIRLVFRSIDDDERGGIFGFNPRVVADTLSVNKVAWYRCHVSYPRGRARIMKLSYVYSATCHHRY